MDSDAAASGNGLKFAARYHEDMTWRRMIRRAAVTLTISAIIVWFATGRAVYTRFPDARRAALAPLQEQDDRLWPGEKGDASAIAGEEFPNRFMLGLLPSGGGKYLISLLAIVVVLSIIWACTALRSPSRDPRLSGR